MKKRDLPGILRTERKDDPPVPARIRPPIPARGSGETNRTRAARKRNGIRTPSLPENVLKPLDRVEPQRNRPGSAPNGHPEARIADGSAGEGRQLAPGLRQNYNIP